MASVAKADRGVEAEAVGGLDDVVVDRLRHADERDAALGELVGDGQGAVAADHHQAVQAQLVEHVDAALRVVALAVARLDRVEERVAAVDGAEDRAADAQDPGDVFRRQDAVPVRLDEPVEAVLETEAGDAVVVGRLDHGANDRVQPRGVAAAGEYSDTPNRFHSEGVFRLRRAHRWRSHVQEIDLKYSIRSGSPPLADQTEMSVGLRVADIVSRMLHFSSCRAGDGARTGL